jgi:cell wall-associated NlpC family hydrolase
MGGGMTRSLRATLTVLACLSTFGCGALTAAALAAPAPLPSRGTVRGTVISTGWSTLTIRTATHRMDVMAALNAAADRVAAGDYPYVWGGGHAAAGDPDIGMKGGPGHNGRRVGYDCSGTVAAVLAGAGLWAAGTGVPSDAGIVSRLRQAHLIVRGAGHGPRTVTLWDDRGSHIFIQLGDQYFGTSDGGAGAVDNPNGGAGWLDDGAPDTHERAYHAFHFVPGALRVSVLTGPTVTVGLRGEVADTASELAAGTRVRVSYRTLHHALVATSVS